MHTNAVVLHIFRNVYYIVVCFDALSVGTSPSQRKCNTEFVKSTEAWTLTCGSTETYLTAVVTPGCVSAPTQSRSAGCHAPKVLVNYVRPDCCMESANFSSPTCGN